MKTLTTLIDVHQHILDKHQAALAKLQQEYNILDESLVALQAQYQQQCEVVSKEPGFSMTFGAYQAQVNEKKDYIALAKQQLQERMNQTRAIITKEYTTIKKYEQLLEQKRQEEALEQSRKDTQAMDELAIQQFERNDT
tara:strand:- start:48 stop:464 length:417 start_codon:yes stop_codon:yes gene_type:complete